MIEKYRSFSFTRHFKLFTIISLILVSVGVVGLLLTLFGVKNVFNFDIDFVGGTTFEFQLDRDADKAVTDRVAALFEEARGKKPSSVTSSGTGGVRVKALELTDEEVEAVRDAVVGEYQIDIAKEGGTGKASIDSPATMTVKDGKATATIIWSSEYYDYMIVDGEKYEPVNEEGNSTFEIPVPCLDESFKVIAEPTAMSEPHEIEYELTCTLAE